MNNDTPSRNARLARLGFCLALSPWIAVVVTAACSLLRIPGFG